MIENSIVGDIVTKKNLEDAATELSINNAKVLILNQISETILRILKLQNLK